MILQQHVQQPQRPMTVTEWGSRRVLGRLRASQIALLYLVAITVAELVTALVNPIWGITLHIAILAGLLVQAALGPTARSRNLLLSLSIAPTIRIVSLGMPLSGLPQEWWYVLSSIPLFASSVVVIRALSLRRSQLGVQFPTLRHWPATILVAASGFGLGLIEYVILRPESLANTFSFGAVALPATILLVGTGVMEELIFRGILQATAADAFGDWRGIGFVSLLFGVLHIGHLSAIDVFFVTGVALYFGAVVRWTGTLLGVSLAHGLTNIMLFIVFPLLQQ